MSEPTRPRDGWIRSHFRYAAVVVTEATEVVGVAADAAGDVEGSKTAAAVLTCRWCRQQVVADAGSVVQWVCPGER